MKSRNDKLIRRLRYLWSFELLDSFLLPACVLFIAYALKQPVGVFSLYGMGALALMLWQGSAYWILRLRAVKTGHPVAPHALRWFGVLKWVNWGILALGLGIWAGKAWAVGRLGFSFDFFAGGALLVLALLEQINYYYYQLMYDCPSDLRYLAQHRRLKKASLGRMLKAAGL